MLYEV
jgi:lysophosphatidate acyltransferase